MLLEEDFLQKSIIENGIEKTIMKYFNTDKFSNMLLSRRNKICEIVLIDLGFQTHRLKIYKKEYRNYCNILYEFLVLTNQNYNMIKDHDKLLEICFIKNKEILIDFILRTRNFFDSILMLIMIVNRNIKKNNINIPLIGKYLLKLREFNIEYISYINNNIEPYILSQLRLYMYY